jgi:hypothetical protein
MHNLVQKLGTLRVLLLLTAILSAVSMLWVDTSLPPEGWGLLRAAVLPALAPIIFMVLMLDMLMCHVLKIDSDAPAERRADLGLISRVHLLVGLILLLSWLPVFLRATYF